MMNRRDEWVWLALGIGGAALWLFRRRPVRGQMIESASDDGMPPPLKSSPTTIPTVPRPLGSPIEVRDVLRLTPHGEFGAYRKGPPEHAHQGVDLVAPRGSHVLAVGDGAIVSANPGLGGIVRKLHLDEPGAWMDSGVPVRFVVYADLGKTLVGAGDRVRRGDSIGLVGSHGFVHFAVKSLRDGSEIFFDPKLAGFAYRAASIEV